MNKIKEYLKFLPWVICILVVGMYLGNTRSKVTSVASVPAVVAPATPVAPTVVEDTLESVLTKEQAMFLSAYVDNLSKYIEWDGTLAKPNLKDNADVEKMINISGLVVNLGHEPYTGLGKFVASYFDEEVEFPQLKGELTPENRVKAIACWQKFKADLDKVEK